MIELNKIYNADCLEKMKDIPDGSIDAVICDLPYGTTSNKWDAVIPFEPMWEQYHRVCKPNAAIVLFAGQPFTSMLVMSNIKEFRHEWIWQKNRGSNFANTVREPMKEHEEIIVFSRGSWTYNKQMEERAEGGKSRAKYNCKFESKSTNYRNFESRENNVLTELRVPSSVQKCNTETNHFHPTQKPVALLQYLVRTYSNEGETVLDSCCGSGTTAIAAIREKRNWICIEKSEEYFNIAKKRIENELKQPTLF